MSVLIIRAHKRYAVCRAASLKPPAGKRRKGLVIELSLEGCRMSGLGDGAFEIGDLTTLEVVPGEPIEAQVRWAREGCVGLRFIRPLHLAGLDSLIATCRGFDAKEPARACA